jgi:hypothetical protein
MDIRKYVVSEISRLQKILALLTDDDSGAETGHGVRKPSGRRKMSAAGRKRIAAAQRARWAKVRAAQKKAA